MSPVIQVVAGEAEEAQVPLCTWADDNAARRRLGAGITTMISGAGH
jgi:hypothetical protein